MTTPEKQAREALIERARKLASTVANIRQGHSSPPRCEPPGEYEVEIAQKWTEYVLLALRQHDEAGAQSGGVRPCAEPGLDALEVRLRALLEGEFSSLTIRFNDCHAPNYQTARQWADDGGGGTGRTPISIG